MELSTLTPDLPVPDDSDAIKTCCALIYQHEAAALLVGDSLHPGGLELTATLGASIRLDHDSHLLDVASGSGASAFLLAQRFGCRVTGIDYGAGAVDAANAEAARLDLSDTVRFERADAEHLPFADCAFDAVLCECAFCLFPEKSTAAREFARVLAPGGRLGLSDLTRDGDLSDSLKGLISWIACIADARPLDEYVAHFENAGLNVESAQRHDAALTALVEAIQLKLLGADVLVGLGKLDLPGGGLATAKRFAAEARKAIAAGDLGYAAFVAAKPH